jgi:predicted Rossmann fold flavoprotein
MEVVIIGGGAAGFFAAIACGEANPDARIVLLEAAREPLGKVKISGGGRCNVTHACFDPSLLVQHYPRGGKALRGAFSRFQPKDTLAWFASQGVELKTEADGRMFPTTDSSETIVQCLRDAAEIAGVKVRAGVMVKEVRLEAGRWLVTTKSGQVWQGDRLLLATGSSPAGWKWAKSCGHQVISPVPSLFTFQISDPRLADLSGVSVSNVKVKLPLSGKNKLEQTGSLLITHWGISGPAILKLSAWGARELHNVNYKTNLIINWLPQYKLEPLREMLLLVKSQLPRRYVISSCPVPIASRLWERLVIASEIQFDTRWAELSNKQLERLLNQLLQGEYQIQGKGVFKDEFVTCGGVDLKEVDFKTMASKIHPSLYFAGEILDIDGVTGGFNFQSAWTTGYLAGQGMVTHDRNG